MSCHWEASQRPMIIKTVWVGGHRHAILSQADCLDCGRAKRNKGVRNAANRCLDEIEIPYFDTDVRKISILKHPLPRASKERRTIHHEEKITERVDFVEKNPLSERVLQWLDLAGQENFKFEIDVETLAKSNSERNEKFKTEYCNVKFSSDCANVGKFKICKSPQTIDDKFSKCERYWEDRSRNKSIDDISDCANKYVNYNVLYKAKDYNKFSEQFDVKSDSDERKYFDFPESKAYERSNVRVKRKKLHIFIPSPFKNEV